ncbi:Hypothetical_protein [Hexamita inflata]|uniref:Hypothetical_protein n=1 Tax=Hexamita inflata TaxID=28002 RepID=A0AA86P8A9_9EUKA|nr:Hypothetical protein HINF_LOCUS21411 [Hexamita inflata]
MNSQQILNSEQQKTTLVQCVLLINTSFIKQYFHSIKWTLEGALKILVDSAFICPFNYEQNQQFSGAKSIFQSYELIKPLKYEFMVTLILDLIWHRNHSSGILFGCSNLFSSSYFVQQILKAYQLYWFKLNLRSRKDVLLVQRSKLSAAGVPKTERIKEMRQNRTFLPLNQIESYDNLNL